MRIAQVTEQTGFSRKENIISALAMSFNGPTWTMQTNR